jgi:hypothetical protein
VVAGSNPVIQMAEKERLTRRCKSLLIFGMTQKWHILQHFGMFWRLKEKWGCNWWEIVGFARH